MRSLESKVAEGRFDLALLRAFNEVDDETAALERLLGEGWDVGLYLITPSPARLLARHAHVVSMLQCAGRVLMAAGNPVTMQSVEHVFRLCV